MIEPENIIIRAFRSIHDLNTSIEFVRKHKEVLESLGLTMVTSSKPDWIENPDVYVIVAELFNTKEIIGGIRVHVKTREKYLPMEDAIGYMDPKLIDKIEYYFLNGGVGEMCGAWNNLNIQKIGLGIRLGRAAAALVSQLKFKILMAIASRPTIRSLQKVGFISDNSIGDNGAFPYPKEDMLAWSLGIMDAENLEHAHPNDKAIIDDLRNNPSQVKLEQAGRLNVEIHYRLNLP